MSSAPPISPRAPSAHAASFATTCACTRMHDRQLCAGSFVCRISCNPDLARRNEGATPPRLPLPVWAHALFAGPPLVHGKSTDGRTHSWKEALMEGSTDGRKHSHRLTCNRLCVCMWVRRCH
eukprot:362353-Chlamydomonas_euryale.AAC.5